MLKQVQCPQLTELSAESIRLWLQALYDLEVLWHFDSHPDDISWFVAPLADTTESWDAKQLFGDSYDYLVKQYEAVMEHCDYYDLDIFELYPRISLGEQ